MKCKTQIVVISPKNTRRFRSNEFHQNSFFFDDIGALLSLQPSWCSKNGKPTCSKNATKLPATKNGKNVHATTKTCKQIIFLTAKTTTFDLYLSETLILNKESQKSWINYKLIYLGKYKRFIIGTMKLWTIPLYVLNSTWLSRIQ